MKVIFCMQIKHQTILEVDAINLGGHGQAMPAQITQSNKFAKTLQYFKKDVRDEVDSYCNEHHNFFKMILLFLMSVARYAKSTQNKYAVLFSISQESIEL